MSRPRNTDWNRDGAFDFNDEWVELYNAGQSSVDISSWQLASITSRATTTFTMPAGSNLAAQGFRVYFSSQSRLGLDASGGELRLLHPDGSAADAVQYPVLREDQALGRSTDGTGQWDPDCVPSPNAPNCRNRATITSAFNLPFFIKHIADPKAAGAMDLAVVATNVVLAAILALAVGFFGSLLNDTLESNEDRLKVMLKPFKTMADSLSRLGEQIGTLAGKRPLLTHVTFFLQMLVLLGLNGLILAFLDPNFSLFDRDGWLLILALALSAGVITLTDDFAQYVYLRMHGHRGVIRMHGGNMVLVILTTAFSRLSGLTPGLLAGTATGIEEVDAPDFEVKGHLLGIGATAVVAAAAWIVSGVLDGDAWFKTLALLIFAAGVQTLFFEMMPIQNLHGRGVFQFHRGLWVVLFVVITAIFIQTMLNPDSSFVTAFESQNIIILASAVAVFCILSAAVYFYLTRLSKKEQAQSGNSGKPDIAPSGK